MISRDKTTVYDAKRNVWIKFQSPADALIAELMLDNRVPLNAIDAVLDAIRHPDFKRSQLTLTSCRDIYAQVAEDRRDLAESRACAPGELVEAIDAGAVARRYGELAGMPSVVFDLVTDYMASSSTASLEEVVRSLWSTRAPDLLGFQPEFLNMSLVHRTWTLPAQRLLFRRVILGTKVDSYEVMDSFLTAPLFGQWVREFGYRCDLDVDKDDEHGRYGFVDTAHKSFIPHQWSLLGHAIQRLPHIQRLALMVTGFSDSNDGEDALPSSLGHQLRQLTFLSSLSISFESTGDFLWELCHTLPYLQRLEYLRLASCHHYSTSLNDDRLPSVSPPQSLKTIVLYFENGSFEPELDSHELPWLLNPSADYCLRNLSIKFVTDNAYEDHIPLLTDFRPCWQRLERLYIKLVGWTRFGNSTDEFIAESRRLLTPHLAIAFSHSASMKAIHFDDSPFSRDILLPSSIEEIGFFIHTVLRYSPDYCDENIHHVLSARPLPFLRRVIFYGDKGEDELELARYGRKFERRLTQTFQFCAAKGICILFDHLEGRVVDDYEPSGLDYF